jgi:hypothetical protein
MAEGPGRRWSPGKTGSPEKRESRTMKPKSLIEKMQEAYQKKAEKIKKACGRHPGCPILIDLATWSDPNREANVRNADETLRAIRATFKTRGVRLRSEPLGCVSLSLALEEEDENAWEELKAMGEWIDKHRERFEIEEGYSQ